MFKNQRSSTPLEITTEEIKRAKETQKSENVEIQVQRKKVYLHNNSTILSY